jgi:hypothetical protein
VDIVLGVSMAPATVRMVLVEDEGAGGVTVDQDDFDVSPGAAAVAAADQVIDAILGTRAGWLSAAIDRSDLDRSIRGGRAAKCVGSTQD